MRTLTKLRTEEASEVRERMSGTNPSCRWSSGGRCLVAALSLLFPLAGGLVRADETDVDGSVNDPESVDGAASAASPQAGKDRGERDISTPREREGAPSASSDPLAELVRDIALIDESHAKEAALRPELAARLAEEANLPEDVLRLQKERAYLEERVAQSIRALVATGDEASSALLATLESDATPSVVAKLLPAALQVARDDPRLDAILVRAVRELRPCPPAVLEALATRPGELTRDALLEFATRERSVAAFVAAAGAGDVRAVAALAEACEDSDAELRGAALNALARIDPPASDPGGLEDLVTQRLEKSRSLELRSALIAYLGRWRREALRGSFEALAANAGLEESLRLAAIGALGRLESGSQDLLLELIGDGSSASIRRATMHTLASSGAIDAAPRLIELLDDVEWNDAARRALTVLAGRDLGRRRVTWHRWWEAREAGEPAATP